MLQKLLINTLLISTIVIISSCNKEIPNNNGNTLEKIQAKPLAADRINSNSLQYPNVGPMIMEVMPEVRQTIQNLQKERSRIIGNLGVLEKSKPGNGSIHVPEDYPTLQQAIDHAPQNSKIIITGIVTDLGDVLVNVPNLTIQGENETSAINGTRMYIAAPGVTVKNLKINMGVVISGTSNGTLVENKINSTVSVARGIIFGFPLDMAVLVDQSTNCIVKNNEIKAVDGYIGIHLGILMNGGSGHTLEANNFSFDLILNNNNFYECIHGEGSNNNRIKDCNIKGTISLNSQINSFGIYLKGSGNAVNNCKAANVSGPYALFGDNNKITDCEARIFKWSGFEANGNNNQIKNCKADGNLAGSYSFSNFGLKGFACIYGENNIFENCTAKNNQVGLELAYDLRLLNLTFPPGNTNLGHIVSKCNLSSNNAYGLFLYKATGCTLRDNTTQLNGIVGINLVEGSNTIISKNSSASNTSCDFNQTNCTGNSIIANQFGSSCTQMAWAGPF